MSAITTLAPSRANIRAVAVPMPDAAPEMIATLPANLMTVSPFVSLGRLSHLEKAGLSGPSELGTGQPLTGGIFALLFVARAFARSRPSLVRALIRSRSNSALCEAPHNADDAERVIMRSRALYSDRTAA